MDVPAWKALSEALRELVDRASALAAAVLDESNDLWCVAPLGGSVADMAKRFYAREIAHSVGFLRSGGKLSIARPATGSEPAYAAESFAGIYVLVVWFEGSIPELARARMRRELSRIEGLTIALPPPDGPVTGAGAQTRRA